MIAAAGWELVRIQGDSVYAGEDFFSVIFILVFAALIVRWLS